MSDDNIGWLAARELLAQHGYKVLVRIQGWVEVLVCGPSERWEGRGADEREALEDVLARMLPSALARRVLPEMLTTNEAMPPLDSSAPLTGSDGEAVESATNSEVGQLPVEEVGPAPVESAEPQAPEPSKAVRTPLTVNQAFEALEPIEDRIEAECPELGLLTPERQRVVIIAWFCRARAIEDATDHAPAVVRRVHAIAQRLTQLTRVYWPGAVVALQLSATPTKACMEVARGPDETAPETWTAAAVLASHALHTLVDADTARGCDEYGWADASALAPAPLDPERVLAELRTCIEKATGPVAGPPPKTVPIELRSPDSKRLSVFLEWARLARWLRGAVIDFGVWSAVVGRLRWLAAQLPAKDNALAGLLDPAHRPATTWAAALGRDPVERKKKQERLALFRRIEGLDRADGEGALAWLHDALPVLEKDALVRALQRFRDVVFKIRPESFTSRTERSRLRKVQADLLAGVKPAVVQEIIDASLTQEMADPEPAQAVDSAALLFASVRRVTEGRRVMFISNRADPDLEKMLYEAFGFREIDWRESNPRRVQAVEESIGQGKLDFVLAATGFQSHSVDASLYSACKRARVTYVRVNKGRPVACAVAIARQVGVLVV